MTEINFGKCIVCLKGGVLTSTPSLESLLKIKEYANKRVSYGETNFSPLCERISNLTEEEFVKLVYHQDCYKLVVHKQHLQRAESRFKKRSLLPGSVTPLAFIGVSLTLHNKTRSKALAETFSQLGLGTSYTNVLNIEKRIACGVANRMDETGGFCLPPFVLLGKSLYFAGDNIDFQVNTQDGQGFFNGTLLVLNQNQTPEDKEKYTAANEALVIPHKITPYNVTYKYSCPPSNDWKEVRFQRFIEGACKELSSTKESFDGA